MNKRRITIEVGIGEQAHILTFDVTEQKPLVYDDGVEIMPPSVKVQLWEERHKDSDRLIKEAELEWPRF